jgi:UDP-galactopyranose mutase
VGFDDFDLVIVGAGPVGCVLAERAAREMAWKCLVVEKRPHVAGNCYDFVHESGLLLHRYGPHCFRTWKKSLVRYLDAFTEWIPGNQRAQALHRGQLFPIPINLTTLEKFFGCSLTEESARALLEEKRLDIRYPKDSEEYVLSKVGRELYEAFYLGYTRKQWDLHPSELAPSVCGRLPIRFNRDDRYVDETYQLMPKDGHTALFQRMISHPLISVELNCDFFKMQSELRPGIALIYTGPIDAYFNYCYGQLPYRSLEFEWIPSSMEYVQPCMAINYPSDHAYTRSVEIKHVTGQRHPHSILSLEYSRSHGEPFYPVPVAANISRYGLYKELADRETAERNVFFCGRLATYSYLNMDTAIESALNLFEMMKKRSRHAGTVGYRASL